MRTRKLSPTISCLPNHQQTSIMATSSSDSEAPNSSPSPPQSSQSPQSEDNDPQTASPDYVALCFPISEEAKVVDAKAVEVREKLKAPDISLEDAKGILKDAKTIILLLQSASVRMSNYFTGIEKEYERTVADLDLAYLELGALTGYVDKIQLQLNMLRKDEKHMAKLIRKERKKAKQNESPGKKSKADSGQTTPEKKMREPSPSRRCESGLFSMTNPDAILHRQARDLYTTYVNLRARWNPYLNDNQKQEERDAWQNDARDLRRKIQLRHGALLTLENRVKRILQTSGDESVTTSIVPPPPPPHQPTLSPLGFGVTPKPLPALPSSTQTLIGPSSPPNPPPMPQFSFTSPTNNSRIPASSLFGPDRLSSRSSSVRPKIPTPTFSSGSSRSGSDTVPPSAFVFRRNLNSGTSSDSEQPLNMCVVEIVSPQDEANQRTGRVINQNPRPPPPPSIIRNRTSIDDSPIFGPFPLQVRFSDDSIEE